MNPRAQFVACPYCGSVLDANSETHQILKTLSEPKRHPPFSFIRIGQVARLGNHLYQVIARTRWRMKYKEYWSEDGESGYSNEVWVYDEWLLIAENKTYLYLIEDRSGFHLSEEIIPQLPVLLPDNLRMRFYPQQRSQIVREYGDAESIYFEGESNYQIAVGDQIKFAMFRDRGISYSSEWRLHTKKVIKEVEFFKETPISRRRLVEAFSENPEIGEMRKREEEWRFRFKMLGNTFVLLLILFVISLIYPGSTVFEESVQVSPEYMSAEKGFTSSPIEVSDPGLYRLKLSARGMQENAEMYILTYVLNQDSAAINRLDNEFYFYAGYDDEGRWEESDRSTGKYLRIKESGTYYLQAYVDTQYANMGEFKMTLYKGPWMSRYFAIGLILLVIPMFITYRKSRGF